MRISRKGSSSSSALSPVTMQDAPEATASSRNISSFGSRQARITSLIFTNKALDIIFSINIVRISIGIYLLNLGRLKTSVYSEATAELITIRPFVLAFCKARAGMPCSLIRALKRILVSNTQCLVVMFQQFVQFPLSQSRSGCLFRAFFHDLPKLPVG